MTTTERGRLAGKRGVVTGAASGIGRSIAERFADEGARTVLLDLDDAALADLAASLGDAVVAHAAVDVTDGAAVTEAVRAAAEALGGIGGEAAVRGLEAAFTSGKELLRACALESLIRLGAPPLDVR